jgi:P63C domain-containing protein
MENKRTIKYEGELKLGDYKIPCYVLDDGTRVLSGRGMQEALKMAEDTEEGKQTSGARFKRYLNQKSLKPFIYKGNDEGHFEPIVCYKGEAKINGYEATVLADICDAILDARNNIPLSSRQQIVAKQCEILIRAFAKVGIIALVDEATGYQYEREQYELQSILKAYISDEILEWQKTFQLSFYKEIFRLWGIPFTSKYIKNKPSFIGHLTNSFIYEKLPKGVFILEKLKEKTPKTKGGNYRYRLHQSLTPDIGREALKKQLYTVETLASIANNKKHFFRLMEEKFGQKEIPFVEDFEEEYNPKTQPKETNYEQTEIDEGLTHLLNTPTDKK